MFCTWPPTGSRICIAPEGYEAPVKFEIVMVAFTWRTVVGITVIVIVFGAQGHEVLWAMFLTQKNGTLTLIGRESLYDILHKQQGRSDERSIGSGPIGEPRTYL